jgi:hypothetical protein
MHADSSGLELQRFQALDPEWKAKVVAEAEAWADAKAEAMARARYQQIRQPGKLGLHVCA